MHGGGRPGKAEIPTVDSVSQGDDKIAQIIGVKLG